MFLDEKTINLLESFHVPNTYWKNRSVEYQYWFRSLLQKLDSSILFDGMPEGWSNDFFMLYFSRVLCQATTFTISLLRLLYLTLCTRTRLR